MIDHTNNRNNSDNNNNHDDDDDDDDEGHSYHHHPYVRSNSNSNSNSNSILILTPCTRSPTHGTLSSVRKSTRADRDASPGPSPHVSGQDDDTE